MRALVVLLVASCGRVSFEPVADAAAQTTCWPAWRDGTIDFEPPSRIDELESMQSQSNASLSPSGLELYFNRINDSSEVMMTTRAARGEPWEAPRLVTELNTASDERRVTLGADALTLILATDRGAPDMDLWLAVRAGEKDTFGAPSPALLTAVNEIGADELDPELSVDGLRLYLSYQRSLTSKPLLVAKRSDPAGAFCPTRDRAPRRAGRLVRQ